ncbi:MAG: hypothetical protein ACI31S_03725 [Bacilli bacterium]
MSLTSLFNFKFLKENMKRSKAIMFLCTFLIPIINVICYLMKFVNSGYSTPSMFELSILSIVGLYVVPVILSITLFSFVYKRKSSDFVMSFPVTKKQIFLSNTLGGIILIVVMNLVNALLSLVASLLLSNVLIDYTMIFDMFLFWTISYIFVFVCTNIAVSVSSNKITTIVVTLLVLFLVPFIHTFISNDGFRDDANSISSTYCDNELCNPVNYECNSTSCEINRKKNVYMYTGYTKVNNINYTIPYSLIAGFLFNIDSNYKINNSMLKTVILSIIYIFIGFILFDKKKFEIVDTSFKSDRVHLLVRSLTTVPILCIYYIVLINSDISINDLFTILFLFALLMTYVIIYDLLTRKKVMNVFKTLASLIVVGILVIFTGELTKEDNEVLDVNDIDTMTFIDFNNGYTYDRNIINYVISKHIDNNYVDNFYDNLSIMISTNSGDYDFQISVTKDEYNYIVGLLSNDKTYLETVNVITNSDVFAIKLGNNTTYVSKDSRLYDKLIDSYKNVYSKEIKQNNNYLFDVVLYSYDNYLIKENEFNIYDNMELMNDVMTYYNAKVKEVFNNPKIVIDSYYIGNNSDMDEKYFSSYDYEYKDIDKFIIDNANEDVDASKPYMYIKFYTYDDYNRNSYVFFTNKVDELDSVISLVGELHNEDWGI